MRLAVFAIVGSAFVVASGLAGGQAPPSHKRLNPVIALLEQNKPVFGVYAPSNGGRRGEPAMARPALDLAKDALAYQQADFLFSGAWKAESIAAIRPSPSSSRRRASPPDRAARRRLA